MENKHTYRVVAWWNAGKAGWRSPAPRRLRFTLPRHPSSAVSKDEGRQKTFCFALWPDASPQLFALQKKRLDHWRRWMGLRHWLRRLAVESGQWLLYRYNHERALSGENPLSLDSRTPTRKVKPLTDCITQNL